MYKVRKYDGKTREVLVDKELETSPEEFTEALQQEYPLVTYEYPEKGKVCIRVWKYLALAAFRPKFIFELTII